MKIVAYERVGGQVRTLNAVSLVVYDRFDNPIAAVLDYGKPGQELHFVTTVRDDDFAQVLSMLGVNRVVFCDQLSTPPPPKGAVLISGPG